MNAWYWIKHGQKHGPTDDSGLRQLARDGVLAPEDLVTNNNLTGWIPAARVRGLFPGQPFPPGANKPSPSAQAPPPLTSPNVSREPRTPSAPPPLSNSASNTASTTLPPLLLTSSRVHTRTQHLVHRVRALTSLGSVLGLLAWVVPTSVACVLLLLLFVHFLVFNSWSDVKHVTDREINGRTSSTLQVNPRGADLEDQILERAAAFLIESEAKVWALQGQALTEARQLLPPYFSRSAAQNDISLTDETERRLRDHLRADRSVALRDAAGQFIAMLDKRSASALEQAAWSQQLNEIDLVLDWITCDAARDFGRLVFAYHSRAGLPLESAWGLSQLLQPLSSEPAINSGVTVVEKTPSRLVVSLYNATVIEEVLSGRGAVDENTVTILWRSNYNTLRAVLDGQPITEATEEVIERRADGFGINYEAYVTEYLQTGTSWPWATLLASSDPLALYAYVTGEPRTASTTVSQDAGRQGTRQIASSSKSLQDWFEELAPSVPKVENIGKGTGSGFLVERGGRRYVVTNRHVIEGAANGVRLHFYAGAATDRAVATVQLPPESIEFVARNVDLAAIALDGYTDARLPIQCKPLRLGTQSVRPGTSIYVIGHPLGELNSTLTTGVVSGVRREESHSEL